MKFWFCEKCGKRLTEADFDSGQAADKQAKGVYCKSCSIGIVTTQIEAIQGPTAKSSGTGMKAVVKDSKRNQLDPAHATTPSMPVLPVATGAGSNRSSRMLLIPQKPSSDRKPETAPPRPQSMPLLPMIAGGIAALVISAIILLSSSPASTPEHTAAAPSTPAPTPVATPAISESTAHSAFNPQSAKSDPDQQANDAFEVLRNKLNAMNKDDQGAALEQFIAANSNSIAAARARKMVADLKKSATTAPAPSTPSTVATPATPATPAPAPAAQANTTPPPPKTIYVKPSPPKPPATTTKTAAPVPPPPDPAEVARIAALNTLKAYTAFQADFQTALRAHDAEKAKSLLAQAEVNDALASKKTELASVKPVLDWLNEIDGAVPKGAANLKDVADFTLPVAHGAPIHVGKSAEFKFTDLKDNEIFVNSKGLTLTVPLSSLPDSTRSQLASLGLGDSPHGRVVQAFADALSAPDHKLDAAAVTKQNSSATAEDLVCLKQLLTDAEADFHEHAAEAAFKDVAKLGVDFDSRRAPQVKSAMTSFRAAFGETAFVTLHAAEINDLESLQWEPDTKGLLLRLKFDDLQAATLPDSSGQNRAGTAVNGPQLVPGKMNSAISLNGTNQIVTLPDELFRPHPILSVAIWFNTTSEGVILGQQDVPVGDPNTKRHVNTIYVGHDGKLYACFHIVKATVMPAWDTPVNDGKWHHVVITVQKEGKQDRENVFLDGARVNSYTGNIDGWGMARNQLGTGQTQYWPSTNGKWFFFKGLLDDFRLYERVLTEPEIQHLAGKRE